MRAIAVAAVVIFHAFPNVLPRGFLGVDVFFVISGFLITGIISTELRNGTFSLAQFYRRRVRRIVPALVVVMAVVLVLGWFTMLPVDFQQLGWHTIGGALFFANIQYWLETGYFDKAADVKPLLHLWSLSVEEQFYLVWPLLLWLSKKWTKWTTWIDVTVCIAILSFVAYIIVGTQNPSAAFYLPVTRFWELMLGGIVALAPVRWTDAMALFARTRPRLYHYAALCCLLVVVASIVVGQGSISVPVWWNVLPTVGTAALIFAGLNNRLRNTGLAAPGMVWLGKISYPLYLWHWPLLVFLLITNVGNDIPVWERAAAVLVSILLAWLTYIYVERPIRFGTFRLSAAPLLGASLCVMAIVGFIDYRAGGFPQRIPAALRDFASKTYDYSIGARVGQCWLSDTARVDGFAPLCFPQSTSHRSVLVWGDSHAGRLWVGLNKTYGGQFSVGQLTRDSCPPVLNFGYDFCRKSNDYAFSLIAQHPPGLVVMYAAWDGYSMYSNPNVVQALTATIARLRSIGEKRILVIGPPPRWNTALPDLLVAYWQADIPLHRVPTRMKLGLAQSAFDIDREMRLSVVPDTATYVSVLDHLCDTSGCRTQTDAGDLLTADYGHLTAAGAEYVSRFVPIRQLVGP